MGDGSHHEAASPHVHISCIRLCILCLSCWRFSLHVSPNEPNQHSPLVGLATLLSYLFPLSTSVAIICSFVEQGKMEIFKRPRESRKWLEKSLWARKEGSVTGGEIMGFIRCIVSMTNSKLGGQQGCPVWVNWCPAYNWEENKFSTTSKSLLGEKNAH